MTDDHDNVIRFPHCARRVDDLDAELAKLEGLLGTTRMRYYKLDGHTPIRVETLKAWADEVAQHDRITALTGIDPWRVDVTKIDDVVISTVFLGLDYLCLSEIKSGHIRDAIRRGPGGKVYALLSLRCAIGAAP
jgi:hypothetical protein